METTNTPLFLSNPETLTDTSTNTHIATLSPFQLGSCIGSFYIICRMMTPVSFALSLPSLLLWPLKQLSSFCSSPSKPSSSFTPFSLFLSSASSRSPPPPPLCCGRWSPRRCRLRRACLPSERRKVCGGKRGSRSWRRG